MDTNTFSHENHDDAVNPKYRVRHPNEPSLAELARRGTQADSQIIKRLAAGADPNERDARGWTALMHVCARGARRVDVQRALLVAGADPNASSIAGRASSGARFKEATSTLELAFASGWGCSAKDARRQAQSMELLVEFGVDLSKANGTRALSGMVCAAMAGREDLVRERFAQGDGALEQDQSENDQPWVASMSIAAARGWSEGVKLLLDLGMDPNAADGEALKLAAAAGSIDTIEVLLGCGVDLLGCGKLANKGPDSALHLAAAGGHRDCVLALARAGADLNAVCPMSRETPAMAAIAKHSEEGLLALADAGLAWDAPMPDRELSLGHWAARNRAAACIEMMVLRGCDFGSRDDMTSALPVIILIETYEGPMKNGTSLAGWVEQVQSALAQSKELAALTRDGVEVTSNPRPRL